MMTYVNYTAACGHVSSVNVSDGTTVYAVNAVVDPLRKLPCRIACQETPYTQLYHVVTFVSHTRGHLCKAHLHTYHADHGEGLSYTAIINQGDACHMTPCMACFPKTSPVCGHWPAPLNDRERRMLGMLKLAIAYVGKGCAEHAYDGCVVSGEQTLSKLEAFVKQVEP